MKIRTIITQDAEVDDQNSLRHFLFYCNEVDLQGIVQTSSKFHWKGVPGKLVVEKNSGDFSGDPTEGTSDKPYRWPGTDWMFRVIDDYEKDYPNLCRHAEGYPTPDYLRSITKVGNVGYKSEMDAPTEGSELIRKTILDDDERTLYLQIWGGTNTIARALMDIEAEFSGRPGWEQLHEKLTKKIVITACGEQDGTFRSYVAEKWPGIPFIKTLQMGSYAYTWPTMPEGESKDSLRADFMKREILYTGSALTAGYCTWLDGNEYEGEPKECQFGANPNIAKEWFGSAFGLPSGKPYDFISEGDSPTYFPLFDFGFRTLENFSWGGIGGRYHKEEGEKNSKGEALNIWNVSRDAYIDRNGNTADTESMWQYVADIQRDFAARACWAAADDFAKADHRPELTVAEGNDIQAVPGQTVTLHGEASSPDGDRTEVTFRVYREISAAWAGDACTALDDGAASYRIPETAEKGDVLHVIVKAQAAGRHHLVHFSHVIVTVV